MGVDLVLGTYQAVYKKRKRTIAMDYQKKKKSHKRKIIGRRFARVESDRFGTYRSMHTTRMEWIRATIEWMKDQKMDTTNIEKWVDPGLQTGMFRSPNYNEMKPEHVTGNASLEGMYSFVYHSDADEGWNRVECQKIYDWLSTIQPYVVKAQIQIEADEEKRYQIERKAYRKSHGYDDIEEPEPPSVVVPPLAPSKSWTNWFSLVLTFFSRAATTSNGGVELM